ncbi:MAG: hypothetical protein HGB36_11740 [Chlorobiaceae bacterium]|nr:hypothetical protein [Chlorobiaceae bacterium]
MSAHIHETVMCVSYIDPALFLFACSWGRYGLENVYRPHGHVGKSIGDGLLLFCIRVVKFTQLRKQLAMKAVFEYGLSLAVTAKRLGVTANAVNYMRKDR